MQLEPGPTPRFEIHDGIMKKHFIIPLGSSHKNDGECLDREAQYLCFFSNYIFHFSALVLLVLLWIGMKFQLGKNAGQKIKLNSCF